MYKRINGKANTDISRKNIGFVPLGEGSLKLYSDMGFKCGLEVHQQLLTKKKLFCRCPAGIYQRGDDFDAEIIRHMRPTLSELGEYDGTALMEFRTKKNITYRLKNKNACTYEIDDTPPFPINKDALDIAIEIALILKTSVVGELHITRKQYLDGSIPTGFQRTAIVGIEGQIPLRKKTIRIIQLSIEEDSCREISDIGHERIYSTDRLGIPLIETVTYPDMKTPSEAEEAAQYIRFLTRSTGKVRTGIGAAREDVNVSINGGTRVEIKGVSRIKWIPALTHIEAFRQKALLAIRDILKSRINDPEEWDIETVPVDISTLPNINTSKDPIQKGVGIKLPGFRTILSFFTQPGKTFADEISERIKVIACIGDPNLIHDEYAQNNFPDTVFENLSVKLNGNDNDAFIIVFGPENDIETAIETVRERCLLAFNGVPNETRKAVNSDGMTVFERVLPGPDRMYPDTDSAPIAIDDRDIQTIKNKLPEEVINREKIMRGWNIPEDTFPFIHIRNLFPLIKDIIEKLNFNPSFVGTFIGQRLKNIEGKLKNSTEINYDRLFSLFRYCKEQSLDPEILKSILPIYAKHPDMNFDSMLNKTGFVKKEKMEIIDGINNIKNGSDKFLKEDNPEAKIRWVMGKLRRKAVGNIPMNELYNVVAGGGNG